MRFLTLHPGLGNDINAIGKNGWNAAHFAVEDFCTHTLVSDMVLRLLRLMDPDLLHEHTTGGQPKGAQPIHMIAGFGDQGEARADIVRELIRLSASVNASHSENGASPHPSCRWQRLFCGLRGIAEVPRRGQPGQRPQGHTARPGQK